MENPDETGAALPVVPPEWKHMRFYLFGLFLFALVYALYFARDFFMPVVLAFLLALMLTPVVRWLGRRGVPPPLSATLLVLISVLIVAVAGYFLSGPVIALSNDASGIARRVAQRVQPGVVDQLEKILFVVAWAGHP